MGIKRHKPEEIVSKLRQVEVLVGQGMPRIDAIRQISVVEQTYMSLHRIWNLMLVVVKGELLMKRFRKLFLSAQFLRMLLKIGVFNSKVCTNFYVMVIFISSILIS